MSNQNQKVEKVEQKAEQQVQQAEQPVVQQQTQEEPKKKGGIVGWLKSHWKGVTAAAVGIGTAVTTSVLAYKKGKAAGAVVPAQQDDEDYSLNPNE